MNRTVRTTADHKYSAILHDLRRFSDRVETRNSPCYRLFGWSEQFSSLPLITARRTAWRKALRELEWFLTGDPECPPELRDWWDGQLSPGGGYWLGYGQQLRSFGERYDQIQPLIFGLRHHPYSRRHIITTWHPADMAEITRANSNPRTPTTCHLSFAQFHVAADRSLHMLSVQRSADVILGLPHNWVQHWALLTWLAHHAGLTVGRMRWIGGDVHLYDDPSHLAAADAIISETPRRITTPVLRYSPSGPEFRAADFSVEWPDGEPSPPCWTERPRLL